MAPIDHQYGAGHVGGGVRRQQQGAVQIRKLPVEANGTPIMAQGRDVSLPTARSIHPY